MGIFLRSALMAAATAALYCAPARPGIAAVTVFGSGDSQLCEQAARRASKGEIQDPRALLACDQALRYESLTLHDLAGTHINRGVVLLARGEFAKAKQDFDAAALLMPEIGETFTDRGAALIGLRRYEEGIADIDHGLTLNPEEPEKAYFNRALAKEGIDDMKGAYFDYLRATELNPKWEAPRHELARFTVAKAPS